jgi:hypothetical protein
VGKMDKKFSLVLLIAILLIIVGGYLIFTNQPHGDISGDGDKIPLKTHDFKIFKLDVPEGSKFKVKNEADAMKYYQNDGKYSSNLSGIIISKGITDSLIGDNSVSISNSTTEQIYSYNLKNETMYKFVSNQNKADVILIGNDLNLLKEVSDTIKIKDIGSL